MPGGGTQSSRCRQITHFKATQHDSDNASHVHIVTGLALKHSLHLVPSKALHKHSSLKVHCDLYFLLIIRKEPNLNMEFQWQAHKSITPAWKHNKRWKNKNNLSRAAGSQGRVGWKYSHRTAFFQAVSSCFFNLWLSGALHVPQTLELGPAWLFACFPHLLLSQDELSGSLGVLGETCPSASQPYILVSPSLGQVTWPRVTVPELLKASKRGSSVM